MSSYARRRTVSITVNGNVSLRRIDVSQTLGEFLRDDLGLTGTKVSCELQVCGACSVLVNDQPVSACSFLAVDADGSEVRTIEGLETNGELHPIQQSFVDSFALQCGYCTPGFVMMAVALLESSPSPSRSAAQTYLDGNLCRCTGYRAILDAVLSVPSDRSEERPYE